MKRFLIALVSLVFVGTTFALVANLFPNTPGFERIPEGVKTIGGSLAKILGVTDISNYAGDGTATNTEKLGGKSASGYLQVSTDCGVGEVIGSIDTFGNPVCRTKTGLLTSLGNIITSSGTTTVFHASGSSEIVASLPFNIVNGDIIDTDTSGAAEIVFTDSSLLSLAYDTTLELNLSYDLGGRPIADVILASGDLWGRILTETGVYNVGNGEFIAGVRGTSFLMTGKKGVTISQNPDKTWNISVPAIPLPTNFTLVHTSLPTATPVSCVGGVTTSIGTGQTIKATSVGCDTPTTESIATLYANPVIRENTERDIAYLETLVTLSGGFNASTLNIPGGTTLNPINTQNTLIGGTEKLAKIADELGATYPQGTTMSNPLCGNAGGNGTETWFPRFGCQPSDILAIGDFTKGDYKIYTRSSLAEPFSTTGIAPSGASSFDSIQSTNFFANGAKIMTSGQNLSYPPGEIDAQIGGLAGRTIEIELVEPVESITGVRYLLFETNSVKAYFPTNNNTMLLPGYTNLEEFGKKLFSFKRGANSATNFIIGSQYISSYINPIKSTIKSIKIRN